MSIPERRAEFVFGTAAEVMKMMSDLPSKPVFMRTGGEDKAAPGGEMDEMTKALQSGKKQPPQTTS
jgi:hypothetical protein